MGAKFNTEVYDRLEVLITRVEAYEKEHHAIDLPDPVEAIKFRFDKMG